MHQSHTIHLATWARLLVLSLLLGVGVLVGSLLSTSTAHAQPLNTVTITDCTDDTQLQSAVSSAATGDTIAFGCSGTIYLSQTLTIAVNLTLDGSGQSVTLDGGNGPCCGGNPVRVLVVSGGVSFTLNALTIAHGGPNDNNGGAGLRNDGGTVSISNSTFFDNDTYYPGGGLFNDHGTVSISNSTFAYNVASGGGGGGLFNYGGTVSISNSTFANNRAGDGGGLRNYFGMMSISNSTFANNVASGANGGGLWDSGGTLNISNSIVANNVGAAGDPNCSFGVSDQGYNLESGTDCGFTGTGDLQNTDPKLDPNGLQNNGGPTQTIALQQGSPAIDHIPTAQCPSTDQRGVTRLDDNEPSCDIGAYESNYATADNDLGLTNMPSNITTNATSLQGAVVTYTSPTVVDEESPLPAVSCTPASGSTFPIGTTTVTCTVTDSDDTNSPVSQSFTVTITPVLTASGAKVSPTEGSAFSRVVASGTAYGAGTLSASIDWGDGQTSSGTLTLATDGSYKVKGSHTYAEEGSFAIKVTVSASGGLSATASSSARVADAALTSNTPTVVINNLAVTLQTVFFDADPNATASDYTATITWGDGSSSTGTIGTNSTSFTATGSHSYAKHGTYTVTVRIKDAGGSHIKKTLTITV